MRKGRVREICRSMKRSRVAVVGDVMLDRYIWGQVDRISPEAPVPVVVARETSLRLGGAANVAWNAASLGVGVSLVGVVGKDVSAKDLRKILREREIATRNLVLDPRRPTTEKIRIIAQSQQVVRVDFETNDSLSEKTLSKLIAAVRRAMEGARVVVVSDYGKGVVSNPVMDLIRSSGTPFLIDPKEGHFSLYRGAFAVTPNKKEAAGFYNRRLKGDRDIEEIGHSLLRDLEARYILVTRGEEGMTLFENDLAPRHFPARASEVYDVTGAGDTVIGVLAAGLSAGATIYESIELANAAAGIVVRELGTAAVTPEELEAAFS